jgi:hypothetical protein
MASAGRFCPLGHSGIRIPATVDSQDIRKRDASQGNYATANAEHYAWEVGGVKGEDDHHGCDVNHDWREADGYELLVASGHPT